MKLKKLQIKNFRLFSELEIDFSESNAIVILGNNGAGKTSILDAIALCLTHFTSYLLSKDEDYSIRSGFQTEDIKYGTDSGHLMVEFDYKLPIVEDLEAGSYKSISITKKTNERGFKFDHQPENFAKNTKDLLKQNKLNSIPIIAYYNVNRTYQGDGKEKAIKPVYNQKLIAYERSLDLHTPNFDVFEKWFIKQEQLENASKVEKKDLNYELPALRNIRQAFLTFMNSIEPDSFTDIGVKRESEVRTDFSEDIREYLSITKRNISLYFKQLSSGERMMIGLVCEIARRLAIANDNSKDALNQFGIVLIDEIELHLHPEWQISIISALKTTFPNIQFIFTTHSPLILSGMKKEEIIVLRESLVMDNDELPDIYSATADEILNKILFAENAITDYDQEKKEIDRLFNNLEFEKAELKLNDLKKKLKSSPKWLTDYELRIKYAI